MASYFFIASWTEFVASETVQAFVRVAFTLLIGIPFIYFLSRSSERLFVRSGAAHAGMATSKGIFYIGVTLITLTCLRELGWDLTAFLGAAGIVGVAIGFASQTSLSNIISGLFLVWEKPFSIGDAIEISGTTGIIQSIGLLSIKLRTYDNRFVRIPNETMIKSNVINISRFPTRRCDLTLSISNEADPLKVIQLLREVSQANPHCLQEPPPVINFTGFGESSLTFLFAPWCKRPEFALLRNTILPEIKARFEAEGIKFAIPKRAIQTATKTEPFPVQTLIRTSDDSEKKLNREVE